MACRLPKRYALLVIDMQEHFRAAAKGILEELNGIIRFLKTRGIPVVYSQHGHKDLESEIETSPLVKWWGVEGSIRYGSKNWALLPELEFEQGDILLDEKCTYDMFHNTRLEHFLHDWNVNTVIISGVMTNLCCETTARSAMVKGYDVLFLSDGTATDTAKHHKATLDNISFGFGRVLTCRDLRKDLTSFQQGKEQCHAQIGAH